MGNFMEAMKETANVSVTENGAKGYKTTGKALVDLNFSVASLRNASEQDIFNAFLKAYNEEPNLAMKWLFYLRDVREGLGERRTFRVIIKYLIINVITYDDKALLTKEQLVGNLMYCSEFGRWDDLIYAFKIAKDYSNLGKARANWIYHTIALAMRDQIDDDFNKINDDKTSISLLAKWMPSLNTSSAETRRVANILLREFGWSPTKYRKRLSALRKKLKIVEVDMSANKWESINYSAVPSRANMIYGDCFLRHDEDRRRKFIDEVNSGKKTVNAGVLFPHDIIHRAFEGMSDPASLQASWKNLKNVDCAMRNILVVADGSGSMNIKVDYNSAVTAWEVATGMALYFAERLTGPYKDTYITFSDKPQIVDVPSYHDIITKVGIALTHRDCMGTNIESTFDLILKTAVDNHLSPEELPEAVLMISDMEFNNARSDTSTEDDRLFDIIRQKFNTKGYDMPKLIFWNVDSRTNTIPMKENENGLILVSGFSVNTINLVLSGKLNPYDALVDVLMSPRYEPIHA